MGLLLMVLGAWGAIVPFVGPYFGYAYTPDSTWTWTTARGWLEVAPGAAAFFAGFLLLFSASRMTLFVAGWLASAAGAWFIVGPTIAGPAGIGTLGAPVDSGWHGTFEVLGFFLGTGAVILFLGAVALGRLSVVSGRDVAAGRRARARQEEADAVAARETHQARQAEQPRRAEAAAGQGVTARGAGVDEARGVGVDEARGAGVDEARGAGVDEAAPTTAMPTAGGTAGGAPQMRTGGAHEAVTPPVASGARAEDEEPVRRHRHLVPHLVPHRDGRHSDH